MDKHEITVGKNSSMIWKCPSCLSTGIRTEWDGGIKKYHYCRCEIGRALYLKEQKFNKIRCKCEDCLPDQLFKE